MFSTSAPSKQLLQRKNRVFCRATRLCARQNLKSNLEYVNILSYINFKKTTSFVNNYTLHSWQSLKPGAPLN